MYALERTRQPAWILQQAAHLQSSKETQTKVGSLPQNLMKGISDAGTLEQEEVSSDGMPEMQKE